MDLNTLTQFFMWCSIINAGFLILATIFISISPEFVYKTQFRFLPISRDQFQVSIYKILGLFKMLFLIFNFTPYVALKIMGN